MKKAYIKPETLFFKTETQQLLDASAPIGEGSANKDGEVLSRRRRGSIWDDEDDDDWF